MQGLFTGLAQTLSCAWALNRVVEKGLVTGTENLSAVYARVTERVLSVRVSGDKPKK